jgi:hypothetical protein
MGKRPNFQSLKITSRSRPPPAFPHFPSKDPPFLQRSNVPTFKRANAPLPRPKFIPNSHFQPLTVIARLLPPEPAPTNAFPDFLARQRKIFGKRRLKVSGAEQLAAERERF